MAGKTAILAVKIISDTVGAQQGLEKTSTLLGKLGGVGKIALAGVTAAATAAGVVAASGVTTAAALEQSVGAIDSVFKDNAGQMHTWAASAATDVGLTKNEFNELGALIGTQLKNGGTAMADMAPKTNELITLGADLASMFGGTTADAVGALSSALKGERDPIERFGVSLNQARIDAKAAELGFKKVGGALSAEANQAATLALIMDQTADAHGNFAKEANTIQGQWQRLNATWDNTKATIGTALLPVLSELLGLVSTHIAPALETAAGAFSEFMGTINASELISTAMSTLKPLADAFLAMGEHLRPLGELLGTIITQGVMPLATTIATNLAPIISALSDVILPTLVSAFEFIMPAVMGVLGTLTDLAGALGEVLPPIIQGVLPIVVAVFGGIAGAISTALGVVSSVIKTITAVITGDWTGAWNGVKSIFSGAVKFITGGLAGALNVIRSILSTIANAFTSIGWDAMAGLVRGINNALGWVADAARNVARSAINAAKRVLGIASPSKVFATLGTQTGQGLALGLKSETSHVAQAADKLVAAAIPDKAPNIPIDVNLTRTASNSATPTTVYNVTVNGALDPDAVADQLVTLINRHGRRTGKTPLAGSLL